MTNLDFVKLIKSVLIRSQDYELAAYLRDIEVTMIRVYNNDSLNEGLETINEEPKVTERSHDDWSIIPNDDLSIISYDFIIKSIERRIIFNNSENEVISGKINKVIKCIPGDLVRELKIKQILNS